MTARHFLLLCRIFSKRFMINLYQLSKHYIDGKKVVTALDDVSLSFDVGEFVVITGVSGSGKSTLLNILSGIDYATSGEYHFNGMDTDSFDEEDWADFRSVNIGIIYQDYQLIEEYTVKENLEVVLALTDIKREEVENKIKELLELAGLNAFENKKVKILSGGQKQRLAIVRAIAKDCRVILADEPTSNIDIENAREVVKLFKKISADRLIIISTHNLEQFEEVCTRKIVLDEGKVIRDEKVTKDLIKEPIISFTALKSRGKNNGYNVNCFGVLKNLKPVFSIFITVFLILFITLSAYSVSLDMISGNSEGLTNTEFFQNLSSDRYIISKIDQTPLSEDNIAEIKTKNNIKYICYEDTVLDISAQIKNPATNNYMEFYIKPISELADVNVGRLPQNNNEVVLSNEIGDALYMMESSDDTFPMEIDNIIVPIRIVGWVKDTEHFKQSIYISNELMRELYVRTYSKFAKVELKIGEMEYVCSNLILDNSVDAGSIITSKTASEGDDISLMVSNVQRNMSFDNLMHKSLEDYPELQLKYGDLTNPLIFNYDFYKTKLESEFYQISVFSDSEIVPWGNFNVVYPNSINETTARSDQILLVMFWLVGCMLLAVCLILVSTVFLRSILKSEIKICEVRRKLGFKNKSILCYLFIKIGGALLLSLLLVSGFYIVLRYASMSFELSKVFVLLSNIPILQFIIITLLLSCLMAFILISFVTKRSIIYGNQCLGKKIND